MVTIATRNGSITTRHHLFLSGIRTTSDGSLCRIRQRWRRDAQLGEDAHRYTNRSGAPLFSFLRMVVM